MASPYTLYYNDYSICSIMVRYTISLCERLRKDRPIPIEQRVIDIQHGGQLTEFYLCDVNPKGTVPVLTIPGQQTPLTESLDITYLLAEHYPFLIPRELSDEIKSLLAELHNINYFSLSYTHKPQRAEDMVRNIQKRLDDPDVSDRWRRALEYKLEIVLATRAPALTKEAVTSEEQKASSFLAKVDELLKQAEDSGNGSPWIFGTQEPTALDAHVVPFLARLLDVGRNNMLSTRLEKYAEHAFAGNAWTEVIDGRRTMYGTYM
ncbi:hypothetical protein ABEF95_002157 [Exophiala dermatitidis]